VFPTIGGNMWKHWEAYCNIKDSLVTNEVLKYRDYPGRRWYTYSKFEETSARHTVTEYPG
jgi:hypothetical protein